MKKFNVAILILAVMTALLLTGCSALSSIGGDKDAESAVKGFLSAVSKDDGDKAKTYLVNPNEFESLTTVAKSMGLDETKTKKFVDQYTSIKYSIEKSVKGSDANQMTVMVFMTIPDYSEAFAQGIKATDDNMNSGQALRVIIEKMADAKPVTVQKAVAVNVVQKDDKWLIDYSNNNIELLNAINGNVLNALHGSLSM